MLTKAAGLVWLLLFFLWRGESCVGPQLNQSESQSIEPLHVFDNPVFKSAEFKLWLKEDDAENSQIVVADQEKGGILTFNLNGNVLIQSQSKPVCRSNTLALAYGLELADGSELDVLGFVDATTNKIRLFRMPDLVPLDGGGIQISEPHDLGSILGFELYVRDRDDKPFILVGSQTPNKNNFWTQFLLNFQENHKIKLTKIREFGKLESGQKPLLTLVDREYFYYSDGQVIRKYFTDPDRGNEELAVLHNGNENLQSLSAYGLKSPGGYIIAGTKDGLDFFLGGTNLAPHQHEMVKTLPLSVHSLAVTSASLGDSLFSKGALFALTKNRLNLYDWRDIAGSELILAPNGIPDHSEHAIKPRFVTEHTIHDTDDPAIWIHPDDPAYSLVIGTDKEDGGGIYVYDLTGKIQKDKTILGLHRPNNVDLEYGLQVAGEEIDFIVVTERNNRGVRVYSFPSMKAIDGGGIPVFEGEEEGDPMGVSLYKNPLSGEISAIIGRKTGPAEGYLWQYRVIDEGSGSVKFEKIREFGKFSGNKEIEAIAIDDELGFVYYSDEGVGVRKYFADPVMGNQELAIFGQMDFGQDMEGISIYDLEDGTGYILVSDQQRNRFNIYPREGSPGNPHRHELIKSVEVSTMESDGSEVTSVALGSLFPHGLMVAMSTDKTFHFYDWKDIAGSDLKFLSKK